MRFPFLMCAGGSCALVAGVAVGGVLPPELPPELDGFSIHVAYDGGEWTSGPGAYSMVEERGQGDDAYWHLEGNAAFGSAGQASFSMNVDPDPFISSSFNVTNGLPGTQIFVITVMMPAGPPISPTSFINGSLSGSVLDMNGVGGATIATVPGSGFYEALVDGGVVKTLYADPPGTSISAPLQGTNNIPTVNYGPEVSGPLSATIGIRNTFSLTTGDTGQMVSTFNIVAIPAPGGALGLGVLGLGLIRRRR